MEFFQDEKVAANVTKISDLSGVYAYLIEEGREKAVLIDTCSGAGNIKKHVECLTQKPLVVICTHGHVDHAGGTFGFENVYLSAKDYELAKIHTTTDFRRGYFDSNVPSNSFSLDHYVPQRNGEYLDLVDGQVFDLGNITLEAITLSGHTQGMTCILVQELRTLLLGDGCNIFTFLFSPESSSVQDYKDSLQTLLRRHGEKFDTVWFSHGQNSGTKTVVNDCIELCDEIMTGKADNIPFNFMGQTAFIAKAINPDFSRVDGKAGNIVYNPHKILNQ